MAHLTSSVEYALHCLLWLVDIDDTAQSAHDLAELQGVSPTFLAKILQKLEKAGIVTASDGVRGGYRLGKPAQDISFLDIVDAIEGEKPLFDCREIRGRCALFGDRPPTWATNGLCAIHAVMLRAEKSMRNTLADNSLADVAQTFARKAPESFSGDVRDWLQKRHRARAGPRKGRRAGGSGTRAPRPRH
jgi:Rrf2 family protein